MSKYPRQTQKGFTLVELIVSVSIFAIVVLVALGSLLVLINANAQAQQMSDMMTNVTFAVDSMTRNIRTGYNYYCRNASLGSLTGRMEKKDCNVGERIDFTDSGSGERWAYVLDSTGPDNGVIKQRKGTGPWVDITSADTVHITEFYITVTGSGTFVVEGDSDPAVVSLFIEGYAKGADDDEIDFSIQTQVAQRLVE